MRTSSRVVGLVVILSIVVLGARFPGPGAQGDDVLITRRIELQNEQGETCAAFYVEPNTGRVSLQIGVDPAFPGEPTIDLYAYPNGNAGVQLRDHKGAVVGQFSHNPTTGTNLTLSPPGSQTDQLALQCFLDGTVQMLLQGGEMSYVLLEAGHQNDPSLTVMGGTGRSINLSVSPDHSAIELLGNNGNRVLSFRGEDDKASIKVRGKDGGVVTIPE